MYKLKKVTVQPVETFRTRKRVMGLGSTKSHAITNPKKRKQMVPKKKSHWNTAGTPQQQVGGQNITTNAKLPLGVCHVEERTRKRSTLGSAMVGQVRRM
jgi:hypothetical protein